MSSKYNAKYGEEDPYGIGLDVRVKAGYVTPKEIWNTKDEINAEADKCKENWEKMMTDEEKAIVTVMTKNAIGRMYERADLLIPSSFVCEAGKFLEITMKFLYTDIDHENQRQLESNSLLTRQTEQEVTEMFVEGGAYTKINILKDDGSYSSATVSSDLVDETIEFFAAKGWMAAVAEI